MLTHPLTGSHLPRGWGDWLNRRGCRLEERLSKLPSCDLQPSRRARAATVGRRPCRTVRLHSL